MKQIPDGPLSAWLVPGENPLQQGVAAAITFGDSSITGARFVAQDGVALGRFKDGEQTSLAVKSFDDWTSIYSAVPTLPATLLRNIARLAKVPVINDANGDITYVSKNLFSVHSLAGGERTFSVGNEYKIAKELFSDKNYQVQNGRFTAWVPPGGTMLFLLKN